VNTKYYFSVCHHGRYLYCVFVWVREGSTRYIIFMNPVSTRTFHKNTNLDAMFLGPNTDLSFLS